LGKFLLFIYFSKKNPCQQAVNLWITIALNYEMPSERFCFYFWARRSKNFSGSREVPVERDFPT